jgi:histidine decarboxylase
VVVAKKQNVERIGQSIGYIGCRDTTIAGSRNGFSPLILWYAIKTLGKDGLRKRLQDCLEIADYTVKAMNAKNIPAWRNKQAITVVIPKVSEYLKNKWQLATSDISHIIIVPGVKKEYIDALIADMVNEKVGVS